MTDKQTFDAIRNLGLAVQKNNGEWQVDYKRDDARRTDGTRYFTDNREDALATAKVIAAWQPKQKIDNPLVNVTLSYFDGEGELFFTQSFEYLQSVAYQLISTFGNGYFADGVDRNLSVRVTVNNR